jgi:nucleoside-diphosphate-sugar epimerase
MKTLVTGCAGFIGSHLTDNLLEQGHEVIGIDCFTDYYPRKIKEANISCALRNKKFSLIERNILDMKVFPDVECIFHMAAQPGVRASWGRSFEIYTRNNIDATQRLLEFYKEKDIKRFVYSSSSSVYGDSELPMRENRMLRPVSPYGVTKLAAEHLCYLYYKNYEVPIVSLRYFTVYGPRQRPDMAINKFVKAAMNNDELVIFGDGTQTRDFTYIDDVVNAIVKASKNDIVGEVFNIGGGGRISVNNLIKEIEITTGNRIRIRCVDKQKGDVEDTQADVTKANSCLRWTPKIGILQGLTSYISWYKQNSN